MNTTDQIEWVSSTGKRMAVGTYEYLAKAVVFASIDGVNELPSSVRLLAKPIEVGGSMAVAHIGSVALTQDRLEALQQMQRDLQLRIDARPDIQIQRLKQQRQHLVEALSSVRDAQHEAHVNFIETASAAGFAMRPERDFAEEEREAIAALADFDLTHPDVKAAVDADRQASVERFLAAE